MRYVSTEGRAPAVSLEQALFGGPAPDGGLYVPESLPEIGPPAPGSSLVASSLRVAKALFEGDLPSDALAGMAEASLDFDIPLVAVEERIFGLELFHGPTLAFKDVGARFMARLVLHFLRRRDLECTVLAATSGDTGSAVAHAFFGLQGIRVVVLFPRGKVSELQRKLFTTLRGNLSALAVEGSFDDCQRLVKQAFADPALAGRRRLISANSINLGRLLPQTFYYFHLASRLGAEPSRGLVVSVPSGNFGNLTAGLFARRMGLPCERFVAATNRNDVVPEYLASGVFRPRPSIATLSNAMDVGNPSNFARILWLYRDSPQDLKRDLVGSVQGDEETLAAMAELHRRTGYLLDPHSAVAYLGAREALAKGYGSTAAFLATAHPAKFPETVARAIGGGLEIPRPLAELAQRPERAVSIPPRYEALEEFLKS